MEQLASAIVGALIAGTAGATQTAVGDAYAAAKSLLAKLVPRFDSNKVGVESQEATVSELAQRLQGLTDDERAELAAEMSNLAEKSGAADAAAELQQIRINIERVRAKKDLELKLNAPGTHNFADIEAIEGNVTIHTGRTIR